MTQLSKREAAARQTAEPSVSDGDHEYGQEFAHAGPRAFRNGLGRVPNNPIVRAALRSILNGGPNARQNLRGWSADANGSPRFTLDQGISGVIEVYPLQQEFQGKPIGRPPWDVVTDLDPFTADVMFALLATLCAQEHADRTKSPRRDFVTVDARTIHRVIDGRSSGSRRVEQVERIREAVAVLAALHFDVLNSSGVDASNGRWLRGILSWRGDKLLDIVELPAGAAWSIRFGQWADWWLHAKGAVWLCAYPQMLLTLNRRHSRASAILAKKAGNVMVLFAPNSSPVRRRLENLMSDIGELPSVEFRSPHWAGRTRERIEEGLLILSETQLMDIEWNYHSSFDEGYRSRGWVGDWLSSSIVYRSRLGAGGARRGQDAKPELPKAPPKAEESAGRRLRALRHKLKLSQTYLAQMLGVSQSHLSRIENGRAVLDQAMLAKAERVLPSIEP